MIVLSEILFENFLTTGSILNTETPLHDDTVWSCLMFCNDSLRSSVRFTALVVVKLQIITLWCKEQLDFYKNRNNPICIYGF